MSRPIELEKRTGGCNGWRGARNNGPQGGGKILMLAGYDPAAL